MPRIDTISRRVQFEKNEIKIKKNSIAELR